MKYFLSLIVIVTLTGCGLKGSLYETPAQPQNEPTNPVETVKIQEK